MIRVHRIVLRTAEVLLDTGFYQQTLKLLLASPSRKDPQSAEVSESSLVGDVHIYSIYLDTHMSHAHIYRSEDPSTVYGFCVRSLMYPRDPGANSMPTGGGWERIPNGAERPAGRVKPRS